MCDETVAQSCVLYSSEALFEYVLNYGVLSGVGKI